jgi:transcriptional regulator with XRE-family HTH domain
MDSPIHLQLKTAREGLGLSLKDVSHKTRIPPNRLQQLEAGDFAGFGSMSYARSFLRAYAGFLGINAEDAVHSLPQPIFGGAGDYQYLTDNLGPWLRSGRGKLLHTPQQLAQQAEASATRSVTRRTAGAVALVACGIIAWAMWVGGTSGALNAKKVKQEKEAESRAAASRYVSELSTEVTAAVDTGGTAR